MAERAEPHDSRAGGLRRAEPPARRDGGAPPNPRAQLVAALHAAAASAQRLYAGLRGPPGAGSLKALPFVAAAHVFLAAAAGVAQTGAAAWKPGQAAMLSAILSGIGPPPPDYERVAVRVLSAEGAAGVDRLIARTAALLVARKSRQARARQPARTRTRTRAARARAARRAGGGAKPQN